MTFKNLCVFSVLLTAFSLAGCAAKENAAQVATPQQSRERLVNDKSIPSPAQGLASQMASQKDQQDAMRAQNATKH